MYQKGQNVRMMRDCDCGGFKKGDVFTLTKDHSSRALFIDKDGYFRARDTGFQLIPSLTISPGNHYRTRSGKPTGRVTVGDTGFEAVVDGRVRVFDAAGGHVHGDADLDIVEAWVPKVGERVRFVQDYDHEVAGQPAIVIDVPPTSWAFRVRLERDGDESTELLESLEPLPVAPQPAAPTLTIEAGLYYKTRDGRKVGPLAPSDWRYDASYPWTVAHIFETGGTGKAWRADGSFSINKSVQHPADLIAEWQETTNVGAQVDTLAEEYGSPVAKKAAKPKFKVGDWVEILRKTGWVMPECGTTGEVTDNVDGITVETDNGAFAYDEDDLQLVETKHNADNDNLRVALQPAGLIRTRHGYGFEIARFGDYVWIDTGKKAPETFRASSIPAA